MLDFDTFATDTLSDFAGNISFSEAEFERVSELLAWRNLAFCALHVECERNKASRRFDALRDSDPFIAETILAAETPDVDDRPTDVDEDENRPTNPVYQLRLVRKAA